ncbi:MAG: sulfatase-like hydrolase/transferase, partial [Bryobacteraceae bacterium]|nr:sulfatase-like hydrolase/transferase [Bryobacteraceae bacterium]
MTRRQLLQMAPGASLQTARPPNIVLIVTDDQGWWDLGCHGNRDIETPVMDKLAAESVEFTRFYA